MSYYTEKTLSSIRSFVDEWSIRKEGGKQSFFVLKEIDKLLADTPVDAVVSSKDVADKKNEVTMLRLERDEQLIRQQLNRIEQKSELDEVLPSRNELTDRLESAFAVNRQQEDTIDTYKDAVASQNKVLKDFQDEINKRDTTIDELTETTRKLKGRLSSMYAANSDQDTTINKLHALLAGEKITLAAYRSNPLSDQVADRDNRIEQLMVLNEALRIDMELAHNLSRDHIAGQDRFIEGLKTDIEGLNSTYRAYRDENDDMCDKIKELTKDLDARNTVIKDFKAIETKETDRLHETIEGNGKTIDELNDMCSDACDKLERIEKIAEHPACDCFSTALDEITKIIQEE